MRTINQQNVLEKLNELLTYDVVNAEELIAICVSKASPHHLYFYV